LRAARFLLSLSVVATMLAPLSSAHAASAPLIEITSPSDGSFADGTISVTAAGTVDTSAGDFVVSMTLYLDGTTFVGSQPCPDASPDSCILAFPVDADALARGVHMLSVELDTDQVGVVTSIFVGAHSPAPMTNLTAPVAGTSVLAGRVVVQAAGQTWVQQAAVATSMQLLVDGVADGTTVSCPVTVVGRNWCFRSILWDSGALSGLHQLQVRLSDGSTTIDSAPVAVTLLRPSVTLGAPVAATVPGLITVSATGTVAGPGDSPVSMNLIVDGNPRTRPTSCPDPAAVSCMLSFSWFSGLVVGPHTFAVSFTTSHLTVTSATEPANDYSQAEVHLSAAPVQAGLTTTVFGSLTAVGSHNFLAGVPVTLTIRPAYGTPLTLRLVTRSNGGFQLRYHPIANATVEATALATITSSAAMGSTTLTVTAVPHCSVPHSLKAHALAHVVCSVAHLPNGTRVTMQFSSHKRWYTWATAVSTAGRVSLPVHWAQPRGLWVRVVVAADKVYGTTYGKPILVRVS
jgi:hypothetical protein